MAVEAGQLLLHYRLIEKIGEGGMGVVWKAEDTKLHRHVALKVLPESMAADPDRRARFEREARAVAALNHPNIVTLHSAEEAATSTGPVHLITMELVEGRTLTQLLPKDGLPLSRLLEIAIPLTDAVSRAHRACITHRDLKPDNIMIDGEGRLRVLDFGLAKLQVLAEDATRDTQVATVTSDTAEGRVLGTAAYMSPEQAEGKTVDARSDVFSLGTILYEMATGSRPFQGGTTMSTIGAILKDDPGSITERKPALPRYAGRIVRRCLTKDPDRRYQTALDLRNELEELRSEIQSGMHVESTRRTPRAVSRPVRWGMLVAGVVLAVVAGVLISRGMRHDPPRMERPYTTVPISTGLGLEMIPTWSPGGEFIAFAEVRNASLDVVVKSMAGGEPVVRADGPGDETSPRWSPDGRYLAYVSTSVPGTPVFLVPPHGGQARKLIDTGFLRTGLEHWLALGHQPWSADGRTLLVSLKSGSGQTVIHRVDRDNETADPLTLPPTEKADFLASYSPDGQTVVFVRTDSWSAEGDVMRVSAGGGKAELLVKDAAKPAFRPDGRHLLFNRAGNIWDVDLDTGEETQLTFESVQPIVSLAVSGTNRIAFQTFWHTTFLYRVDVASGDQRQLTSHTGDNFGARFSPDGETIAYGSTRTGNGEIYLHPLDGGPETRLTDRGTGDSPDWSPDGKRLVYFEDSDSGARRLTVVNRDGGGAQVLVEQPGFVPARWSPSGKRIVYAATTDGVPSLWTVGSDGDGARSIDRGAGAFDWYLDDRHGIYTTVGENETEVELVAIDLEAGKTRSLYLGPILELDVAPDGSAVALAMGPGHMSLSLAILRLESSDPSDGLPSAVGEPEYLVEAEGTWHLHLGGWSSDSKSIVYTRDQDFGDIFELVQRVDDGE